MRHKKHTLSPLFLLALGLFLSLLLIILSRPLLFRPAQIAVINSGPQRYTDSIFNNIDITNNVSYGAAQMDVYAPVGDTAPVRAAIIWIHGGGFGGGDKGAFSDTGNGFASTYAKLGYVSFALNYRLDSRVHNWADAGMKTALDRAVTDTHSALKYILAHPEYRIDPHQIVLAGTSAGAVTALYAGYQSPPTPIAAVVSLAGAMLPADYGLITPISPPTIILHGERDRTVPFSVAQQLDAQLTTIGTPHEFHSFPSVAHGVAGEPSIHNFIRPFLASHLSSSLPPSPSPSPIALPSLAPSPSTPTAALQLTGLFNILYGDSQNGQSSTLYTLTTLLRVNTNTPATYYLNIPSALATSLGGLLQFNRQLVSVTGSLTSSNPPTLTVTQLSLTPSPSPTLISPTPIPASPVPPTTPAPSVRYQLDPLPSPSVIQLSLRSQSPRPSPTPRPTTTPTPFPMYEEPIPSSLPQIIAEWTPTPAPSFTAPAKPNFWQRLWQSLVELLSR